ncbi:MAG: transposase [Chloroflexi bacterium]|nr:transposase [Chloroflexota bacterium]
MNLPYLNGRKTIQTMTEMLTIAFRPKHCVNPDCTERTRWPAATWQHLAPKGGTYGYDVIAQLGWERQKGRTRFAEVRARLTPAVQISESQVRYLYHFQYLPLLACHERQHLADLATVAQSTGLILGLDGLMPEGGEPQLWVVRELHHGWTLRCGWLARQDHTTFAEFLQPIADLGLPVAATLSDKQTGLLPALEQVFPQARHSFCQVHYLSNAARPIAAADEQMKITLRKTVRAEIGELISPKTPTKTGVLTITGLLPSPVVTEPLGAEPDAAASAPTVATPRETIVQDLLDRVRYLLVLKARPPFRLAGIEMVEQLQQVVQCLNQLLRHQPEPRLQRLHEGLQHALKTVRADYRDLRQAADWLHQIAETLDPAANPPRTGQEVQTEWQAVLETIQAESDAQPRLKPYAETLRTVSASYAPGLFHTYDLADLPRTNNARESEFRDLQRRLLATTGQRGATKRWIQRSGAWELIPGPSTLCETIQALTQVAPQEFAREQQRVRTHRRRFRMHTRSAKQADAQLKDLVRRWKMLPACNPLK